LDAPHHTPTQDAKQGAKMTNFQPVSSRKILSVSPESGIPSSPTDARQA
jgi:hypothetical protein